MASDVTINSALTQSSRTQAANTQLAEDFSQFLTLLTVQLQNQDPLSPMDTTEFTNQLVAFTGVEQQINTNQKLDSLVALQLGSSTGQALGYVGKNISYVSSEFNFDGENTQSFKYALNDSASTTTIRVVDESGATVYEEVGSTSVGQKEFSWDGSLKSGGRADAGTYSIVIDALDADGEAIDSTVVVEGRVTGIESQNGQIYAIVGERAVSLGNILNVTDPNSSLSTSLSEAFDYIGKTISYNKSSFQYDEDSEDQTRLGYDLSERANTATISIYDINGNRVFKDDISVATGKNSYLWDGTLQSGAQAESGQYTYQIDARDADSNTISYNSLNSGTVTSVESKNGKIYLNVGEDVSVAIDEVVGFG